MSDLYLDPIVQKVIEKLEESGPSKLQGRYINGDILLPNKSELPMCYIAKDQTLAQPATNLEEEHIVMLVASVILDWTQDLNEAYNIVAGSPGLYDICEGRNADYTLKDDSLLAVLRSNQVLDNNMWIGVGTPVQVNYGIGIEKRGPNTFSVEATLRFTVRVHVARPGL